MIQLYAQIKTWLAAHPWWAGLLLTMETVAVSTLVTYGEAWINGHPINLLLLKATFITAEVTALRNWFKQNPPPLAAWFGGQPQGGASNMKNLAPIFILLALLTLPAIAQTTPNNVVGFGAAGSFNATPPIAGLGFYAKQIAGTQTYSATMCQVLPNNTKPLTVTTNCGTGIAQQAPFSIHGVTPYFILNGGIQWQGSNVGFQYSGLAILPIPLKKTGWYLGPYGGWNKGSVANGTGYQPSGGLTLLKQF